MPNRHAKDRIVCRNRKATHRFHILETLECGLVLCGSEVKSLRAGRASIGEAFARIEQGELWLIGFHIGAYEHATIHIHQPLRRRKLLVNAKELQKLRAKVEHKGHTLIPLSVQFNERGLAKVDLGVAVGKGHADKRQALRTREHRREMDRATRPRR